ncbi:hypothetical protein ACFQE1_19190 [Halobium palmae]|uniref:Uncharacterized protein n=1 Tax=Halobium palmae TaxID=1776492 RepID=A0ABD5S4F1_9EURY
MDRLTAARDAVENARSATSGGTQDHLDTILDELEVLDPRAESERAEESESFEGFDQDDLDHVQELEEKLSALLAENALDATAREHLNEAATALRRHRQAVN